MRRRKHQRGEAANRGQIQLGALAYQHVHARRMASLARDRQRSELVIFIVSPVDIVADAVQERRKRRERVASGGHPRLLVQRTGGLIGVFVEAAGTVHSGGRGSLAACYSQ